MSLHLKGSKIASLFPVLAYAENEGLFFMQDKSIGFGFICEPLAAADHALQERINVLLNSDWPKDTILQFTLYTSPNIHEDMHLLRALRQHEQDPIFRTATQARIQFLQDATQSPIDEQLGTIIRNFTVMLTCKIPLDQTLPTENDFKRATNLRTMLLQSLKTIGFDVKPLNSQRYLQSLSEMLHPHETFLEPPEVETDKPLNVQLTQFDKALDLHDRGLKLGATHFKTLSFKRLPQRIFLGHASHYAGDRMTGTRGIKGRFWLTVTLSFPASERLRSSLETKRQWAINQAYGPMLKFVPLLGAKKQSFEVLFDALSGGDRPTKMMISLILSSDSETQSLEDVANARTYYKELGFELFEDRFFCLPIFLNSLPFGADRAAIRDLFRYKTMATQHALPLLPLFSDWKGTGTPAINVISRSGQLMSVSLYDSGSNYNCCIAAQSGSGKSFLVNEMISSYLAMGGHCFVIDVGRSYEKLCEIYQGDFLQFGRGSEICLNPFEIVENYEEEADILVGLVAAMCAPTESLSDFQTANLKREMYQLWQQKNRKMTLDDIAEVLKSHSDQRIKDVGVQLYAFTSEGEYGRFFVGQNTIKFKNRFTVLELEELKGRKNLQQVVLLQLIYQIQQDMYLGERNRQKILFIDEAWDLLTHGDVAKFIETGYRRFRKYGGSAVTITQSVNDLYGSPTGKAIAENSANMYLLGQKAETVNQLRKEERLPLTQSGYELLKTVHTSAGLYSEIFFITERGTGIGRLIVDPFHKLLYSSRAEDVNAIKQYTNRGYSTESAILAIIESRQLGRADV